MTKYRFYRYACAGAVSAALIVPAPSLASYGSYFIGNISSGARQAGTTRTDLNTSISYVGTNRVASASAHYPGGWDLVGTYAQNDSFVCKSYPYTENYGALVKNIHSVDVYTQASESYGSDSKCNW